MGGNGQTPMGGPATPMLTPDELQAIWNLLYARSIGMRETRPVDLLLASAQSKIERHLQTREAWAHDARTRKLKTSR